MKKNTLLDHNDKSKFIIFNFETTKFCNAKCPVCFRTRNLELLKRIKSNHLSIADFQDFILNNYDYIKRLSNSEKLITIIKFCGELGDPMMHPNLDDLIHISNDVFDRVEIFTNGGLRSNKWVSKMLMQYNKLEFTFGIDGLSEPINNLYRVNVNTKLALSNMYTSSKIKKTRWDYNIFTHNYHEIKDVIKIKNKFENLLVNCRFSGKGETKIVDDKLIEDCCRMLKDNNITYYVCPL